MSAAFCTTTLFANPGVSQYLYSVTGETHIAPPIYAVPREGEPPRPCLHTIGARDMPMTFWNNGSYKDTLRDLMPDIVSKVRFPMGESDWVLLYPWHIQTPHNHAEHYVAFCRIIPDVIVDGEPTTVWHCIRAQMNLRSGTEPQINLSVTCGSGASDLSGPAGADLLSLLQAMQPLRNIVLLATHRIKATSNREDYVKAMFRRSFRSLGFFGFDYARIIGILAGNLVSVYRVKNGEIRCKMCKVTIKRGSPHRPLVIDFLRAQRCQRAFLDVPFLQSEAKIELYRLCFMACHEARVRCITNEISDDEIAKYEYGTPQRQTHVTVKFNELIDRPYCFSTRQPMKEIAPAPGWVLPRGFAINFSVPTDQRTRAWIRTFEPSTDVIPPIKRKYNVTTKRKEAVFSVVLRRWETVAAYTEKIALMYEILVDFIIVLRELTDCILVLVELLPMVFEPLILFTPAQLTRAIQSVSMSCKKIVAAKAEKVVVIEPTDKRRRLRSYYRALDEIARTRAQTEK